METVAEGVTLIRGWNKALGTVASADRFERWPGLFVSPTGRGASGYFRRGPAMMSRVEEGDDGRVGSPEQSPPHHRAWDVTEADTYQDEAGSPSARL